MCPGHSHLVGTYGNGVILIIIITTIIVIMIPSGSSSPIEVYEATTDFAQGLEKLFDPISSRDFLRLCVQCLHLAEQNIGKPTKPYGAMSEELRSYVTATFAEVVKVTGEEKLARLAALLPPVQVYLAITVVQAEGLVASDVSGKSDPYCVLRVGASRSKLTSVKNRTVCPVWDETFRIPVDEPARDVLHLAVWDKDPRTICGVCREIRDVHSCGSFLHFLREVFEILCSRDGADDFMGAASMFVNEIPCTGYEHWLNLRDANGRGAYGRVYARLAFECRSKKNFDRATVLRYHYYMCLAFLLQRVSMVSNGVALSWTQWEQCLSEEGLTLLYRHSQYHGLSHVEEQLCQITALANVFQSRTTKVNYSVLYRLLSQMRSSLKEKQNQLVVNSLEVAVKALTAPCLERFTKLHDNFSFRNKYERIDLLGLLFCCVTIEALVEVEVTDPASVEIRNDASTWYRSLLIQEQTSGEDSIRNILSRILRRIDDYHKEADRIFKSAWNEPYTQIVYKELDTFVCGSFQAKVAKFCSSLLSREDRNASSEEIEDSLRLFYLLKEFHINISSALPPAREELRIDRLQEWFGFEMVLLWFKEARGPVSGWISDIVTQDNMTPVARDIKYGSAIRDTIDILHSRYVKLWRKLELRNFHCAMAFTTSVAEDSSHFVHALSDRVESAGYFDVVGEFEVSTQLCVAVSSLGRIASFLQETITEVESTCSSNDDIALRTSEISFPLEKALDVSLIAMSRICTEAVNKIQPELRKKTSCVSDASSRHLQDRALYELVRYVDACIGLLHEHLDDIAFRKMLRLLWRSACTSIKEEACLVQVNYLYRFTTAPLSFKGLQTALFQLKDVFHAGGAGLSTAEIDVAAYIELDRQLTRTVRALEEHDVSSPKDAVAVAV